MTPIQAIAASGTVASAATVVAQSAVEDGISPTTGWAGGLVVAGVGVYLWMDRRERAAQHAESERRRAADERQARYRAEDRDRIAELEREIVRLHDRIIDILQERKPDG
jgi:hypothetical protein